MLDSPVNRLSFPANPQQLPYFHILRTIALSTSFFSHPYAKTPGGGVSPNSEKPSDPVTLSPCRHINGKGHHCSIFTTDPASYGSVTTPFWKAL